MNVLIIGGYGFVGSAVAKRFYKENCSISVMDTRREPESFKSIKHQAYRMKSKDMKCEAIFESGHFDVVIYLAQAQRGEESEFLDGFINSFNLCLQYNVAHFLFLSSDKVYERSTNYTGVLKRMMEEYCQVVGRDKACTFIGFRVGEIYGPLESGLEATTWIMETLGKVSQQEQVVMRRGQVHQLIYIEDVVDALYKGTQACESGYYDLSGGEPIEEQVLMRLLKNFGPINLKSEQKSRQPESIQPLDNGQVMDKFKWKPKYTLESGLQLTYRALVKQHHSDKRSAQDEVKEKKVVYWLPYVENVLFFSIIFLVNYSLKDNLQWHTLFPIDLSLIYIFVMSIYYGIKQGLLAAVLAGVSYIYIYLNVNQDISSILYSNNHMIHLLLYVTIAVATSYTIDNKKREIEELEDALAVSHENLEFITQLYEENVKVKNQLHDQILNSEDSLGKVYSLSQELNSLLVEDIFGGAVTTIEKLMKTTNVVLYKVGQDQHFLRLMARSKEMHTEVENSLNVHKHPYIGEMLQTQEIMINRELQEDRPIMAAPIVYEDQVIAVVVLEQMPFENLTLYYENFFKVAVGLIGIALGHALKYEQAITAEKYLPGTKVMTPTYLQVILKNKKRAKECFDVDYTVLKLVPSQEDNGEAFEDQVKKMESCIRDTDYIGMNAKQQVYLILSNSHYSESTSVIERLKNKGIETILCDEV